MEDLADEQDLRGAARVDFRRRHSQPVLDRSRVWLEEVVASDLPPSDPAGKAARFYLRHYEALTRFVDEDIPLDTHEAEREFQRHAKLRQASLFAGSPEGGHRWATLFGIVRTAQKCEVDILSYLTWVFERRGTHRRVFGMTAAELTPMAYKAAGCPGAVQPDNAPASTAA